MIGETPDLVSRHSTVFRPESARVVTKLFVPGEESPKTKSRASALVRRVLALPENAVTAALTRVLADFSGRHQDFASVLERNGAIMSHRLVDPGSLGSQRKLLLGACFTHEYAVEAAALCNPSLVPHHRQDGLAPGETRVVLSLRGIGEGHLSSIGFATGVLGLGPSATWDPRTGPLSTGEHRPGSWHRAWLRAALTHDGCDNEIAATVTATLPEYFGQRDLDRELAALDSRLLGRAGAGGTVSRIRELVTASYTVRFPARTSLAQRVLWPGCAPESHGMEDARFVRFTDGAEWTGYRATYTAYNGSTVAPRLLESADLTSFTACSLTGPAARNKGMALFPRPVGGRQLALCRGDGETTSLAASPDGRYWSDEVPLRGPTADWELLQVGNCGSPLETAEGWLVLTHGVGPMRTYAIGALLLDRTDPARVVAALPAPLLVPDDGERNGYVPNVVYSCGGLINGGTLWIPYGCSDSRVALATVPVAALLARLREAGAAV
ncbi:glycoside hydrolase family 130 protein [Amycolatopsis minnesotensis]|uniref:Glycoside hydrolase family 130 protein n=1 Tax=Amycolatopsis minnesotensis TaxID=337894 RepID=A0ABP5CMI5_9PSEU